MIWTLIEWQVRPSDTDCTVSNQRLIVDILMRSKALHHNYPLYRRLESLLKNLLLMSLYTTAVKLAPFQSHPDFDCHVLQYHLPVAFILPLTLILSLTQRGGESRGGKHASFFSKIHTHSVASHSRTSLLFKLLELPNLFLFSTYIHS